MFSKKGQRGRVCLWHFLRAWVPGTFQSEVYKIIPYPKCHYNWSFSKKDNCTLSKFSLVAQDC